MGIRNILFDLDNTLLDFNKAERKALTGTLQELGITPSETIFQRYSQLNLAQWKLLEQEKRFWRERRECLEKTEAIAQHSFSQGHRQRWRN